MSNMHSAYQLNQQQMAVDTLRQRQTTVKGSIDMFIRSGSTVDDAGLYFKTRIKVRNMDIKINSNMVAKYDQTKIDVDHVKHKINEHKAEAARKTDEVCISEEGKIALEEKMAEARNETIPHIKGKLSDISSQYYIDIFGEKLLASEKSKDMDAFFTKMKTIYQEMQADIEAKYNNDKQEETYFISQNGGIEALTKDKELGLLDYAYETHKMLVTNSMKIWEKGF